MQKTVKKLVIPNKKPVLLLTQKSDVHFQLQAVDPPPPQVHPPSTPKTSRPSLKEQGDDIANFRAPMKPAYFVAQFKKYLTAFERSEVYRFPQVYFLRREVPNENNAPQKGIKFFNFKQGEHIAYRYEQIQCLGKGSFGCVLKCYDHKTGQNVAIKLIHETPKTHNQMVLELNILKRLQSVGEHHNIIQFLDVFTFRSFFCIIMELLSIDVYTGLSYQGHSGLQTENVRTIARQIGEAVRYMHSCGVIHCDIKPENILYTNQRRTSVKLVDFGCSCYDKKTLYMYIQSRYYRAPEVVLNLSYGQPIDVWSLGCVLYEVAVGVALFPADDEEELIHMMAEALGEPPLSLLERTKKSCEFVLKKRMLKPYRNEKKNKVYAAGSFPLSRRMAKLDPDLADLITRCLIWDPAVRITMEEFVKHPFCAPKEFPVRAPACVRAPAPRP